MKKNQLFLVSFFLFFQVFAQKKDSLVNLKEVIIIGKQSHFGENAPKITKSVEEYLETSSKVTLIKRGAYAWEPMLANMQSERAIITIDGMRIFGACTDKMDPITSYVETANLQEIDIQEGQEGNHCGATIAGTIDLKRKKTIFTEKKSFSGSVEAASESNNGQQLQLANLLFSSKKISATASFSHRKADNYFDGKNQEISFSQFEKYNVSGSFHLKTGRLSTLSTDVIWDYAVNVGYPALPMDVSLAKALIGSLSFQQFFEDLKLKSWQTKLYANQIYHEMDDTSRPIVPVHMDMPGLSTTFGGFSKLHFDFDTFSSDIQLNGFHNYATAEMTMYYRSGGTMFMYTWPQVATSEVGVSTANKWQFTAHSQLHFGMGLNAQHTHLGNLIGRIFYPQLPENKHRFLPSAYLSLKNHWDFLSLTLGIGYGERAPSVSEAYGMYLFNSFDGFEYVGNPFLEDENAYEANFSVNYHKKNVKITSKIAYFHIKNFIIGRKNATFTASTMLPTSNGLRFYEGLSFVNQFNADLELEYTFLPTLLSKTTLSYGVAKDFQGNFLPFMRPFSYQTSLLFKREAFSFQCTAKGNGVQTNFNPDYGEDRTPDYFVLDTSANYSLRFGRHLLDLQMGVENLFNRYYSTYADWQNLPRMGRNVFLGAKWSW